MTPPAVVVGARVARTEAEGPGTRFALWVQGCARRCPGCCNPELLAHRGGALVSVDALVEEVFAADVEGLSLLGGEPLEQAPALAALAARVRARGLSVMVYTGYTLGELRAHDAPAGASALLAVTDLLVDGPYLEALRTTTRRWIGSDNQVLHFLTDRYTADDPRFAAPNTIELHYKPGSAVINGFPVLGARTRL